MKKIIHHVHRHVHRVRSHPEHVRRRILHATAIISGILLLLLWVLSLGRNFTDRDTRTHMKRDIEPLSALKDNFVGGYQSIITSVPEAEQ